MTNARIIASGWYVPNEVLNNDFFIKNNPYKVYVGQKENGDSIFKEETVSLDSERIYQTTGMLERRKVAECETHVDMIAKAFAKTGFDAKRLDGIIVSTVTHGNKLAFPSLACRIQEMLGIKLLPYAADVYEGEFGFDRAMDHIRLRIREEKGEYLLVGVDDFRNVQTYKKLEEDFLSKHRALLFRDETMMCERVEGIFNAKNLTGILVGSTSHGEKSAALETRERLEADNVKFTEDIGDACAGFMYAMNHARLKIQERGGYWLVVGVETLTRIVDYKEINCNLFGDGCGLVVLGQSNEEDKGILSTHFMSDISGIEFIYRGKDGLLRMPKGREVLKQAVRGMISVAHEAMAKAAIDKDEVDFYNPHQANGRIIKDIEERVDPNNEGKVIKTIERFGNMSTATGPVSYAIHREEGAERRIKEGNVVVWTMMGSGLVYGSAVERV